MFSIVTFNFLLLLYFNFSTLIIANCTNPIYCTGSILHTVQMARIFTDSKSFVDLRMRHSTNEIIQRFEQLIKEHPQPLRVDVEKFVLENFESENEIERWHPPDFQLEPSFLSFIPNGTIRQFAKDLMGQWVNLARKLRNDVHKNPHEFSIIPIDNGFIVPGGRFREFYYWDSYWIIQGLLVSGMQQTAKGIIDNYLKIVQKYGFVPNGGRIYYLNRSQPPLLSAMVHEYFLQSKNISWLEHTLPILEKELNFWFTQRTMKINRKEETFTVAHYGTLQTSGPRPEAYTEDIDTVSLLHKDSHERVFRELKSGTETGWDYSSRWIFNPDGTTGSNLSQIRTSRIAPVDLNAFLCGTLKNLAQFYHLLGNVPKFIFYQRLANQWQKMIEKVFWNEQDGIWYDLDVETNTHRPYFFPSNLTPLWSKCTDIKQDLGDQIVGYLKRVRVLEYPGGIPASLQPTGQQWDFPNVWPPLQDLIVDALEHSKSTNAHAIAQKIAVRWVDVCLRGFVNSGDIYEKYNANFPGIYGGGGEYNTQKGFGWTIGVALKFIYNYFTNFTNNEYNKL